jgi:predicted HTH transcriptional regulator
MPNVWQAEDSLREKKVESDLKDLLRTLVAFANSVAPNDTAKVFIGEKDDGTVQGVTDVDSIQKLVRKTAEKIYPDIYYRTEVYERDGKYCVRVDIKNNGLSPHFAGAAWVREGAETVRATEGVYQQMVDLRQSKTKVLNEWLDKDVTVEGTAKRAFTANVHEMHKWEWSMTKQAATIVKVASHWTTFKLYSAPRAEQSEPMEKILLSWDDTERRLKVIIINWVT